MRTSWTGRSNWFSFKNEISSKFKVIFWFAIFLLLLSLCLIELHIYLSHAIKKIHNFLQFLRCDFTTIFIRNTLIRFNPSVPNVRGFICK